MNKSLIFLIIVLVLVGGGVAAWQPALEYWKERNKPNWRTAEVSKGQITSVVNSTGTIEPVLSVQVGSFVSGPIIELHADFNQLVKKGELLAKIDPRLFKANVDRDKAVLASRAADVQRVEALLQQSQRDEKRAELLLEENENFISQSEMDKFHFNTLSLQAQLLLSKASIDQAKAALTNSEANLGYTDIVSPVDGMIIDRKINEGQTLAAQFQTPELFIVAPDMEKKMRVIADVDEADIGLLNKALRENRDVFFRVDAYPDDLFEGNIEQIRKSAKNVQTVVTYPVVIGVPNPDLKLLPGMTASISFQVDRKDDVVRIPNSALRFYPKEEQVRKEDRKLLEGEDEEAKPLDSMLSATEKAEASLKRTKRHVWVVDGRFLRAIAVTTGLIDNKYTELISGELKVNDKLVTGIKPKKS